jgi:hypothetical protein
MSALVTGCYFGLYARVIVSTCIISKCVYSTEPEDAVRRKLVPILLTFYLIEYTCHVTDHIFDIILSYNHGTKYHLIH